MSLRVPVRRLAIAAVLVAAAIQFVHVDRTNPPVETALTAPPAVREILVGACFDCHSHETTWPWYSRVAPLSWLIADHVTEGRRDLNFSRWPAFDLDAQDLLLREIAREVAAGDMPPRSYAAAHSAARLTAAQRDQIVSWARPATDSEADLPY